jgi:nicotinamide/nicotinate riboside kinase
MTEGIEKSQTVIIGLSGPSSSGKTTLARLLRSIFNIPPSPETNGRSISLFILHEDDFYKTDEQIPLVTVSSPEHSSRQLQDWDCADSIDFPLLESTLCYVKEHGRFPPDFFSKEDQNSVGDSSVPESIVSKNHAAITNWLASLPPSPQPPTHLALFLLDGFLLYPTPTPTPSIPTTITSLLDLKLFLRSTHDLTKSRRKARSGYVTLEGFWADPPGYVDDVVWPNYVKEHAWMFEAGDVDAGPVREDVVGKEGVVVGPGNGDRGMMELLEWGIEQLKGQVERVFRGYV